MRRLSAACLSVLGVFLLVPSLAFAQATITGVVKDASGAVLPGVTVEAANPDLIEKVRTAVTDGDGVYRIVDLRGGTYSVTFSLQGFSTVRREDIQLSGSFVATINVDLKVGTLQETIVVTGETPLVDVQSVSRQTTLSNELINAIPAARSYAGLMTLMPNTVTQGGAASNTQVAPNMVVFGGAGGRSNEGRLQVDGISVGTAFNGAGVSAYVADVNNAQEIVLTASGGLGEAEAGGPTLNIVPKEGGNKLSGQVYGSQVTDGMVGSNYTQDLKDRGLTTPGQFKSLWDYNLGLGGPVVKDRLWYFLQVRQEGYMNTVPGMFANANANDPNKWTYVPDRTRPAYQAASFQNQALRLTGQITAKNKITGLWDEQKPCEGAAFTTEAKACRHSDEGQVICAGASPTPSCSATSAPETGAYRNFGQRIQQLRWTSPRTNKLLYEAGFGTYISRWGGKPMPGQNPNLIRVTDQCTVGAGVAGEPCEHGIANLNYRNPTWASNWTVVLNYKGSASYVMGAHNMKVGYQGARMNDNQTNYTNDQFLAYRFNNGVPNQFTQSINQFTRHQWVQTAAFYGQDSYTMGRVTFQGALRYDHAWSGFPEQEVIPVRFFPQSKKYPFTKGVSYNDLEPRGGVAMDVFGNGKTSVKFNFGRYLEAAQNAGFFITNNPIGRLSTSVSRTWTDADKDFVVDCDLLSQAAQSPTTTGSVDTCGVGSPNFGTEVVSSTLDPSVNSGWGIRTGDWQWGGSIQQQLLPRVSAEFSYQRRWLLNFSATDNRATANSDYDSYSLIVPVDQFNQQAQTRGVDAVSVPTQIANLYAITAAAAGRTTDNFVTLAKNYGDQTNSTDSLSLNVTARPRFGLMMQGGFNYARTTLDSCEIREAIRETSVSNPNCNSTTSLLRATALASYTVPKIDVQLAGTFRSDQGASLNANYTFSSTASTTTLGRGFAGTSTTTTVNLLTPGELYGDRVNEFDFRIGKNLRYGKTRTNVGLDIYNVFNKNPVLTYNEAFSPTATTWLRPNSVLQPRFIKFSAQFNF